MLIFDESQLIQALSALSVKHRVAFAASCCERLFPNYHAFALMEHWGDPDLLRQALNEVWGVLDGVALPEKRIRELVRACEDVAPDTEDFVTFFTGAALNAASAVVYTLECCLDGDPKRTAIVGRLATDTIDAYLHIVNDPDTGYHTADPALHEWVRRAPLMVAELEKQQQDLEALKARPELDPGFLDRLRRSSSTVGIQPFARGMVKAVDSEPVDKEEDS